VVVSLAYLIFNGWACAAIGFRLMPNPLAAITAPDIFRKPLLLTFIGYSLLSSVMMNIPLIGTSFPNMGGATVSSGTHCPLFMESLFSLFRRSGSESMMSVN
jgi:hypothetical protein